MKRLLNGLSPPRTTLIVQLMQSTASLGATALVFSCLDSSQFGIFALMQACALLMLGMVDSGIFVPLLVRFSRSGGKRSNLGMASFDLTIFLALIGASVTLVLVAWITLNVIDPSNPLHVPYAAATAVWGLGLGFREWMRQTCLLIRSHAKLIAVEFAGSVLMLGGLVLGIRFTLAPGLDLFVCLLSSALVGLIPLGSIITSGAILRRRPRTHFAQLYVLGRWSFVSAQITWIQSQTYLFFAGAMLSSAAVGTIAAARMIYSPLQTVVAGLSRGLLRQLAAKEHSARVAISARLVKRLLWVSFIAFAAWAAVAIVLTAYFKNPLIQRGYDFRFPLILGWAAAFFFSTGRTVVTQILRAFTAYRTLAIQGGICAMLSIIVVPLFILVAAEPGAIGALATVELVALVIGIISFKRISRAEHEKH